MTRSPTASAAVVALGLVLAAGLAFLLLRDDESTTPTEAAPDVTGPFEPVDADGAVRLRWTTETDRGAQGDLVVVVADALEARLEGALQRWKIDDLAFLCYSTGDDLTCESDPNPTALIPTAGKTTLAADDAESRTIAGRAASCWHFEVDTTTTQTCADDVTGISLLEETTDLETGESFRQTLVEWGPASASDVTPPPEVDALAG